MVCVRIESKHRALLVDYTRELAVYARRKRRCAPLPEAGFGSMIAMLPFSTRRSAAYLKYSVQRPDLWLLEELNFGTSFAPCGPLCDGVHDSQKQLCSPHSLVLRYRADSLKSVPFHKVAESQVLAPTCLFKD